MSKRSLINDEPNRMLEAVVIVVEGVSGVVGRVDVDALDLACELLLKRLQCEQIIPVDQPVIEDIGIRNALRSPIGKVYILKQNARFQARSLVFANPSEFKSTDLVCHDVP